MENRNFHQNALKGRPTLRSSSLDDLLFISMVTVPELPSYDYLSEDLQEAWTSIHPADSYIEQAGRYAEFGKIAAIGAGVIRRHDKDGALYLITSTYAAQDERTTIADFVDMADGFLTNAKRCVVGHGIRRHELPFCAKRLLVNNLQSRSLNWLGDRALDTADYWSFGDTTAPRQKANVVARILGIETNGEDYKFDTTANIYHEEANIEKLANIAHRKVVTVAQLLLRFRSEEAITEDRIIRK